MRKLISFLYVLFYTQGELPKVPPMSVPRPSNASAGMTHAPPGDWSMKPAERDKYSQLFDSLQPNNGLIPGNKVCFFTYA